MKPLTIVCWKWRSDGNYLTEYGARDVNILAAMLRRNLTIPYTLKLVSDDFDGVDSSIERVQIWTEPNVKVAGNKPNCYRRLRQFAPEARYFLGERVLSLDLDCVITGNLDSILSEDVDFKAWNKGLVAYQGGMILHKPGKFPFLWTEFDPQNTPRETAARRIVGSDQAWISMRMPKGLPVWTKADGILSYKGDLRNCREYLETGELPPNTKIVFYHGQPKPAQCRDRFVLEHWRE